MYLLICCRTFFTRLHFTFIDIKHCNRTHKSVTPINKLLTNFRKYLKNKNNSTKLKIRLRVIRLGKL